MNISTRIPPTVILLDLSGIKSLVASWMPEVILSQYADSATVISNTSELDEYPNLQAEFILFKS
jgi:hypothetical protein